MSVSSRMISPWHRGTVMARRISKIVWSLLICTLVVVLPLTVVSIDLYRLSIIAVYVIAAIGLNIALGYGGQFFIGQPVIMAASAYTAAYLTTHTDVGPFVTLLPSLAVGVAVGTFLALPGLRLSGYHFAAISIFTVIAIPDIARTLEGITGGENGINNLPRLSIGGRVLSEEVLHALLVAITAIGLIVLHRFLISGWGLRLRALRDAPLALESVGIGLNQTRLVVYFASAIPAALSGWLFAFMTRSVQPLMFGFGLLLLLMASVELGGSATLFGPILGAVLLGSYREIFAANSKWNTFGLGVVLLVVAAAFQGGLAGVWTRFTRKRPDAIDDEFAYLQELTPDQVVVAAIPNRTVWEGLGIEPIVRAVNLQKSFGGMIAVDKISLNLHPGEIVAVIGPNGSGKTTLVNLLTGTIEPDGGSVEVLGTGQLDWHVPAIARSFQVPALISSAGPYQNVELGLLRQHPPGFVRSFFRPRQFMRRCGARVAEAKQFCEDLGIHVADGNVSVAELPLGVHRLTEVARSLATGAPVLCLDEPAAGLTDREMGRLGEVLKRVAAGGRSVLIVEHHVGFVRSLADRIVLCEGGRISADVSVMAPTDDPSWARVQEYIGRAVAAPSTGHVESTAIVGPSR